MAKLGDIVFVNEIRHGDGESFEVSAPGIVIAVTDTDKGYGKDHEFLTVRVFGADGSDHVTELDHGTGVGEWNETEYSAPTFAPPVDPPA